ncbi:hypothetical protein SAMN04490178_11450 [Propionispora vibrioides]|uniref:Uncharacterized protein n=1 Tax=Propionispora vibrioides TaxID=112903 RepID=A0A1H8W5G8_9FIRM|nr:hypothetical protein SAMN04490178_11450 [Propionispora vibrioides]
MQNKVEPESLNLDFRVLLYFQALKVWHDFFNTVLNI